MFNSHIAQKQQQSQNKNIQQKKKVHNWLKRYHNQVQPTLIKSYNKRINGFIKKIEEKPILLHDESFIREISTFRKQNKDFCISEKTFKYKDSNDWTSLFTPAERAEREQRMKFQEKHGDPKMAFRSIGSQSSYEDMKTQFRKRQLDKQINPPMKYTNKNYLISLKSLPKFRKKMRIKTQQKNKGSNISRQSLSNSKEDSQVGNYSDLDIMSINNSSFFRKIQQQEKSEKEKHEEEQLKALAHNRMYFKQLVDLEQSTKQQKNKQNLRQLLVKCGVYKKKERKVLPKVEVDYFLELLTEKMN